MKELLAERLKAIHRLDAENQMLRDEVVSSRQLVREFHDKMNDSNVQVARLTEEVEKWRARAAKANLACTVADGKVVEENKRLRQRVAELEDGGATPLQDRLDKARKDYEKWYRENQEILAQKNSEIGRLKDKNVYLQLDLDELRKTVNGKIAAERDALITENQTLKDWNEDKGAKIIDQAHEITRLRGRLKDRDEVRDTEIKNLIVARDRLLDKLERIEEICER